MKVAVLVGSLRKGSFNHQLAKSLEKIAGKELTFEYVDMNLPLFNQDLESEVVDEVEAARDVVRSSDLVLLVTPEYNRSTTGVMKNAMDWLSRPYAKGVIQGKKVAIAGATGGNMGTGPAQAHLRSVVGYLNMRLMGQPEYYLNVDDSTFDKDGYLTDDEYAKTYVKALIDFMKS